MKEGAGIIFTKEIEIKAAAVTLTLQKTGSRENKKQEEGKMNKDTLDIADLGLDEFDDAN